MIEEVNKRRVTMHKIQTIEEPCDEIILDNFAAAVKVLEREAANLEATITNMPIVAAVDILKNAVDVVIKMKKDDLI